MLKKEYSLSTFCSKKRCRRWPSPQGGEERNLEAFTLRTCTTTISVSADSFPPPDASSFNRPPATRQYCIHSKRSHSPDTTV